MMKIIIATVTNLMRLLRNILRAPVFADDEKTRVGKLLHWTLLVVASVLILDCLILAIFAPETIPTFWINYLGIAFSFFCLVLLHRGWVVFTSTLFALVIWLLLVYYLAISGGVLSPAFGFLNVSIIAATVLLGTRGALSMGLLTIFTGIFLFWGSTSGWLISQEETPTAARMFGTQTVIFITLTLFMTSSSRSLLGALKRSRQSEKRLAEQNQQLQNEIAKRQRIEKEQRRLIAVIEANPDFIGVAAANGQVIYINKAGRKLVGLDESVDVQQTRHETYYPEATRKKILTEVTETVLKDGIWQGESSLLTVGGREIPCSQLVLAHYDTEGKLEYYSSIMRDISDQKQAEAQRLELALQEERLKSFKEFLSHISHDLKTPMTVIRTSFHMLEKQDDMEKRQKRIETIGQQLRLLEKYIQDLLDLSRLDNLPSLNISLLDMNELLQTLITRFTPLAEQAGLSLSLQLNENLPSISADAFEFERALVNLIENAIHYTPSGGKVKLIGKTQNGNIIIEVQDTGIGIKEEEKDTIFERFFRSESARAVRPSGTGLGLAIVKRIVEIHGGQLHVESRVEQGTVFRILLPRRKGEAKVG
jgi:PAS domain S-box-containing protein